MSQTNNDELRFEIEHMFISAQQDGAGLVMGKKSVDGSFYQSRTQMFTDMVMEKFTQQRTKLEQEVMKCIPEDKDPYRDGSNLSHQMYGYNSALSEVTQALTKLFKKEG